MQGILAAHGTVPSPITAAAPTTVLIVISTHIVGGPAKGLLQLIPQLHATHRVRPLLCTFVRPGAADTPFIRACRQHGIALIQLRQRFNFDPRPLRQLREIIARENVAIVQTHGYKENLFGLALRSFVRKPWICFTHGTTEENIKVRLYHALDSRVVRLADRIVSVSPELTERFLAESCRAKTRLVENAIAPRPPAVDATRIMEWKARLGLTDDPIIACVGRLSPEKGQAQLIDAAAQLQQRGRQFQLVFVGDGPLRAELEDSAMRRGLAGVVHFIGQQADMDLVYNAVNILALPSHKEGMPNVILEAMNYSLPIVSTAVGAVPSMLSDGKEALLVEPGDTVALADALDRVLSEPVFARGLGRAAYQALFPRFSLAQRVNNMEAVYTELLKESV